MKRLLGFALLLTLFWMACSPSSQEKQEENIVSFEEVMLKLKLKEGDSVIYTHHLKTEPKSIIVWDELYQFLFVVDKVDIMNQYHFLVYLKRAASKVDDGSDATDIDTDRGAKGLSGESLEMYNDIAPYLNRPMKMLVSEKMKIVENLQFADGTPLPEELLDMNKAFIEYPARALSVGDFWDRELISGLVQSREKINMKIKDIDKSYVSVDFEDEIFLSKTSTQLLSEIQGVYVIDRSTGLIHNATLKMTQRMMGNTKATLTITQRKPSINAGLLNE